MQTLNDVLKLSAKSYFYDRVYPNMWLLKAHCYSDLRTGLIGLLMGCFNLIRNYITTFWTNFGTSSEQLVKLKYQEFLDRTRKTRQVGADVKICI